VKPNKAQLKGATQVYTNLIDNAIRSSQSGCAMRVMRVKPIGVTTLGLAIEAAVRALSPR
jgi:hypothetical protein